MLAHSAGKVVVAAPKVGDAVPSIGAREVENMLIASLMPSELLWCNQLFAKGKSLSKDR